MGLQLVGSRLLAPHFGSSIIVWAFLIATFLAAFTTGAIFGGVLSRWEGKRFNHILLLVLVLGVVGLAFTALGGRAFLTVLDTRVATLTTDLLLAVPALFFLPVASLSVLPPLLADALDHARYGTGLASGLIYGLSTVGNIAGVMVVAFMLVPLIGTAALLKLWLAGMAILALACVMLLRKSP